MEAHYFTECAWRSSSTCSESGTQSPLPLHRLRFRGSRFTLGRRTYAKAEVQLVGFDANLRQDVKLLKCVRAIMEPAVLLLMDDWWIKYPPDIDALLHFARIVGASTPASARISAVRLACSERKYLSFGGLRTPAKGLYAILDQPLLPSIWNRPFLRTLSERQSTTLASGAQREVVRGSWSSTRGLFMRSGSSSSKATILLTTIVLLLS